MTGFPVQGVRVVVTDGASHAVDSNEIAFRLAATGAFRQAFKAAGPLVLEPIMVVECIAPNEFQGVIVGALLRRKGLILSTETRDDGWFVVRANISLEAMFGYSTDLRSSTEGKGEYSMEYLRHEPATRDRTNKLIKDYQDRRQQDLAKKR